MRLRGLPVPAFLVLGLQKYATVPGFIMQALGVELRSSVCKANTLPTKPSPAYMRTSAHAKTCTHTHVHITHTGKIEEEKEEKDEEQEEEDKREGEITHMPVK